MRRLRRETAACRGCDLGERGRPRCVGFGSADADVAVVGTAPGQKAPDGMLGAFLIPYVVRWSGLKLVGSARAFHAVARAAELDLRRVYSTNAVKCALAGNRAPTPAEVIRCASMHLWEELTSLRNLRVVLIYGKAVGDPLGLSDFGLRRRVDGTLAEAVLLRHPNSVLRKWTRVEPEARNLRVALRVAGTS